MKVKINAVAYYGKGKHRVIFITYLYAMPHPLGPYFAILNSIVSWN